MEEADAVDLSKENIQPLKQGRNASILGLALQAQTDEQLHQQLLKMQEAYELKIRTYSGADPLELWVEYISWVEQSFPKHGLEGNLEVLLQKCFSALRDEERYKQDQRFVKLWIKFIEMQTNDRLEVYRFLSGQGIGTACAEFYRAWAYEFEQMEDYKHADAVYQLAYTNMAQPAAELEAAHTQFQLRFARVVLNNQLNNAQDTDQNPDTENQRLAMASLCPVGPKHNKVGVVRVGQNVLSATPGTLPNPSSSNQARSLRPSNIIKDCIQIYQEDSSDSLGILGKGRATAPVPTAIHGFRNKENTQGPGTWNKPGAVRSKIPPQVAVYQPQVAGPSFQVHRDETIAATSNGPSSKTFTPNVLKPRKLEDNHIKETLAVYEQQDPSVRPMYPKEKVYGGGREFQLEEIMAIEHWKEKAAQSGGMLDPVELERLRLEEMKREIEEKKREMEKQKSEIEEKLRLLTGKPSVPQVMQPDPEDGIQLPVAASFGSEASTQQIGFPEPANNSTGSAIHESKDSHSSGQESCNFSSVRVGNRSTNNLNVLLTPGEGEAPIHTANHSNGSELSLDRKKGGLEPGGLGSGGRGHTSIHNHSGGLGSGGRGHTSIYNQSLTVHTKIAMNEVDDLWRSPNPVKFPESPAVLPPRQPLPDASAFSFDICRDETDVIRPPQPSHPLPASGLKTAVPSVLSDRGVKTGLSFQPQSNVEPFRVLPDDNEESLAHALAPDMSYENAFKEPVGAPIRSSLKKGPALGEMPGVVLSKPVSEQYLPDRITAQTEEGFKAPQPLSLFSSQKLSSADVVRNQTEPMNDFPIFSDQPEAEFPVFKEPEAEKNDAKSDFQFNVFVDEQEANLPAQAVPPVTPGNKLNVIAKEKENAQKFSHVEIEEIAKKPKMAAPRRSILPQLNNPFKDAVSTKDNIVRRDFPLHFPEDDDTCTTKVFSGGFLAASTPFTGAISRDKVSDFDFASRDLNGSIFANAPMEDGIPPNTATFKSAPTDDKLSTIYEASISSTRTSSSQSAYSATGTASSDMADEECPGATVSSHRNLNIVSEENEDLAESNEPYHHDVTICINGEVDPFDQGVVHDLLNKVNFPQAHHKDGLLTSTKNVPMKRNDTYVLENEHFKVIKQLGAGAYAKVWQVVEESTKRHVALKIQKPSWQWEYYICREIQLRLRNKDLASSFMRAEKMFVYNNGSVLLTELVQYGSLLDLTNKLLQAPVFLNREPMVMIIADHLIRVVEALHSCDIIHGDLKPDNILIRSIPRVDSKDSCLMLIDFGRSIDMSLFPLGTTFHRNVKTDGFSCVEMQSNRPWTYQTDLYGLASTIHCLLLGNYMKVREINGRWQVQQSFPRSADKERWTRFFNILLNVESCNAMPDLKTVREDLLKDFQLKPRHFDEFEKIIKS